jgi:UPF0271 protein
MPLDLNCDLGEGEPRVRTRALMRWVTSANVACGGHAGDVASMEQCVRLAREFGVHVGAHPGPWSRRDRGREAVKLTPAELELLLVQQAGALATVAGRSGVLLHHVKLHGALYHATEADAELARVYLQTVQRWWPGAIVYVRAGGRLPQLARKLGIEAWAEAFLDRGYRADGTLVPRGEDGALVCDVPSVSARLTGLLQNGEIDTVDAQHFKLRPRTVCVHSDTPNAVQLARAAGQLLRVS